MAGKGGGGAWKVAYADFVTAMMAFFLVMWICGQDQKIRRSVSDYFSDPFGSASSSVTKKPVRSGSLYENLQTGIVPLQDSVPLGKGRKPHTLNKEMGRATKLVVDWLYSDKVALDYWEKQADEQREAARWSQDVKKYGATPERVAMRMLTLQLQDEMIRDITKKADGVGRHMLDEMIGQVNWSEIAEDLVLR